MKFASMDFGNYTVEHNTETNRFDIYRKGVGFIISCLSMSSCNQVLSALDKNDSKETIDQAILDEIKRLNAIPENRPANSNLRLSSPLAVATRELLNEMKGK